MLSRSLGVTSRGGFLRTQSLEMRAFIMVRRLRRESQELRAPMDARRHAFPTVPQNKILSSSPVALGGSGLPVLVKARVIRWEVRQNRPARFKDIPRWC